LSEVERLKAEVRELHIKMHILVETLTLQGKSTPDFEDFWKKHLLTCEFAK
jgi:hypothetical protein